MAIEYTTKVSAQPVRLKDETLVKTSKIEQTQIEEKRQPRKGKELPQGREKPKQKGASKKELASVVSDLEDRVQKVERNLQFDMSERKDEWVIRVTDRETRRLLRTISGGEALRMQRSLKENNSKGLLIRMQV